MMKRICPKCGCREFFVIAHVAQLWKVDEDGMFLDCIENCVENVHEPDDEDLWECAKCAYSAAGREFNKEEG